MKRVAAPLVLLLLATIWTWPAAIAGSDWLVGRHFDLPGTIWFIGAAPRLLNPVDMDSGFPDGVAYSRPDSWILLGIGLLLRGVSAVRIHNLAQVLGVWMSALAAEGFARAMGARSPWSWIAGISFGFSGLAATTLLEGHVYHLIDPWMPALGWAWWRATRWDGRPWQGALAGVFWSLCLASSAYLGLAASLLVLGIGAGAAWAREPRPGPLLAAAAVAIPVGLLYIHSFGAPPSELSAYALEGFPDRIHYLEHGSATPLSFAAATASLDFVEGSLSLYTGGVVLALCMVAPVALGGLPGWRRVMFAGLLGLLFAFGPAIYGRNGPVVLLPMGWLIDLPAMDLVRFPARFGWVWALCAGVLAARSATAIADRVGWRAWPLLAFALVDLFFWGGMPGRQRLSLAAVPSAYAGEGPVLDLYPETLGRGLRLRLFVQSMGCYYQLGHHRPISDDCVTPFGVLNPRLREQRALADLLMDGRDPSEHLRARGFASVAYHPDLFPQPLRRRLGEALEAVDSEPTESLDGGEHVLVYDLQ